MTATSFSTSAGPRTRPGGTALVDAHVGVSAHPDRVEARFAFRTRLLDYLWAGLPILAIRGDDLAERCCARGIGLCLEPGMSTAGRPGSSASSRTRELHARCRAQALELARDLTWERTTAPLRAFCRAPQPAADRRRRTGLGDVARSRRLRGQRGRHRRPLRQRRADLEVAPDPMSPTGPALPVELSVVVVNFNTGQLLGECLASVRRFAGDVDLEVLVVDNASTDGSMDVLREHPEVQGLRNASNVGFARAVNQALAVAKGRFVLLLNPDTRIESPVFRQLLAFAEAHPGAGIVGPRLVNPDGTLQTSAYRFPTLVQAAGTILGLKRLVPVTWLRARAGRWLGRWFGQFDAHRAPRQVDLVTGACMLVRRQVLDAIGGLDPRFFLYFEEKDYCLRARRAGFGTYFDPSAEVVHVIGGSSRSNPGITVVERCRSMRQYHDKHGGAATRLVLRGLFLGGGLFRLAGAVLVGDRRAARAWREVGRLRLPPSRRPLV